MRILKTTQTYYPYLDKGGPPAKVRAIARALAQRGHDVTVLTAESANGNLQNSTDWQHRRKSAWGLEWGDEGVRTIYLPTIANYRATTINPRVTDFCKTELAEFDLVHAYGLYDTLGSVVMRSCRHRGIPYVLEPLGMFQPRVRSLHKKRFFHAILGKSLFRWAEIVIATSEAERAELIAGGVPEAKIVLRRNGVDVSEFRSLPARGGFRASLGIAEETPLVLFLGRLSFIKGLDLLVRAFARTEGEVRLVIAGPDDNDGCVSAVRRLIDQLSLDDRVVLCGPLYGSEKLQALTDADVFVLPSRYESFGNVAAEAIACGLPVLVTDRCGIAPLIADQAGLAVPGTVEALAAGMNRLLHNKSLSERFRADCPRMTQRLSWEEPVNLLELVYESMSKERLAGNLLVRAQSN